MSLADEEGKHGIFQNQAVTHRKLVVSSIFLSSEMVDHSFCKARGSPSTAQLQTLQSSPRTHCPHCPLPGAAEQRLRDTTVFCFSRSAGGGNWKNNNPALVPGVLQLPISFLTDL